MGRGPGTLVAAGLAHGDGHLVTLGSKIRARQLGPWFPLESVPSHQLTRIAARSDTTSDIDLQRSATVGRNLEISDKVSSSKILRKLLSKLIFKLLMSR